MPAKYCRRTVERAPSAATTRSALSCRPPAKKALTPLGSCSTRSSTLPCRYTCGGSCAQRLVDPRPGARHEVAAVLEADGAVLCHPDVRALRHAGRGGEGGAGTAMASRNSWETPKPAPRPARSPSTRSWTETAHPCRRRSRAQEPRDRAADHQRAAGAHGTGQEGARSTGGPYFERGELAASVVASAVNNGCGEKAGCRSKR